MIDFDSEFKKNFAEFKEKRQIRLELMRKDKEKRLANRDSMLASMSLPLAEIRNLMSRKKELREKYENEIQEINSKLSIIIAILYKNGIQQKELAGQLNVTTTTINKWAHYDADPK